MNKFQHGGNIYSFAKKYNVHIDKIIDFSSNINFLKPKVKFDLNIYAYPDPEYATLKKTIAKKYNIEPKYIEVFNGATDAIFNITKHYKNVVLYAPIYAEYKKAKNVFLINRFKNIYDLPEKGALVVFVNPSTPDGKYYNLDDFFDIWQKQNNTVLIDESFLDFCARKSATEYLSQYEKLIILKSFSKFYGCPGVRVGCTISKIKFDVPLWNISAFDQNYTLQALNDPKFAQKSIKNMNKNKESLYKILLESNLFKKIYDSCTNFYLAKLKNSNASTLQRKLSAYKILIRNCANFDFLDEQYVRFAVKSKQELKILKGALK